MAGRPWTPEQHKAAFERSRAKWKLETQEIEKNLAEQRAFCDELINQITVRENLEHTLTPLQEHLNKRYLEMIGDPQRSSRRTQLLLYDAAMIRRLTERDSSTIATLISMRRSYCYGWK
jgi:hypothetical protein